MSTRTFGILTGIIGSVVGAYYWTRQRSTGRAGRHFTPPREQGTVIFDNTPSAAEGGPV